MRRINRLECARSILGGGPQRHFAGVQHVGAPVCCNFHHDAKDPCGRRHATQGICCVPCGEALCVYPQLVAHASQACPLQHLRESVTGRLERWDCQPTHVLQLSVRLHHQLLRSGSCVTSWRSAHVSGTEEKDVGLTGRRQSSAQETKLATARAGHPCVYRASRSSVPAFVRRHPATPGPGAAAAVTAAGPRGHLCASAEAWRSRKRRVRASRRQMSAPSIPVHNAPGGGGARDVYTVAYRVAHPHPPHCALPDVACRKPAASLPVPQGQACCAPQALPRQGSRATTGASAGTWSL